MTTDKLSHTTWKCKYHIVFAPKYRRQVIYRQIKGHRKNPASTVRFEKSGNLGGRGLSRSHPYVGKYSTELECIAIYGIFKGKKFPDDL